MSSLELYLIRHGKTICNEKRLYCGSSDIPLSENGKNELLKLKDQFIVPCCEEYFTSGMIRANETFEILFGDIKYKEIRGFSEYNFGDFEMKSYEQLRENQEYISWITDEKGMFTCPNGESKSQFDIRIKETFEKFIIELIHKEVNSVALVCHGGTIGKILMLFHDNSKSLYDYQPQCGKGYKVTVEKCEILKIEDVNIL